MRRRRVIGGLVATALVAIVAYSWATMRPDVTAADVNRIRIGMTLAEVERLFGPPDQIDPRSKSAPGRRTGGGSVRATGEDGDAHRAAWSSSWNTGSLSLSNYKKAPRGPPKSIYVRFMH